MSIERFESTLLALMGVDASKGVDAEDRPRHSRLPDPSDQINPGEGTRTDTARSLNAAFLITLAGPRHRLFWEADVLFEKLIRTERGASLGRYCQRGRSAIWREIETLSADEARLEQILAALSLSLEGTPEAPSDEDVLLSAIPVTVAYLKRAVAAAVEFSEGRNEEATSMLETAAAATGSP